MLQHNRKVEKSQPNTFVDGVHVKISEQYKPPRRVVLPVSCQNCSPGEALYSEYDFKLEENILNKLAEWKSARREQVERRKERLKTEKKVCEEIEHFSNVSIGSIQNEAAEQTQTHQSLNHKLTDSVLTPICAKQNSPSHKPVSSKFNFSDFESDNSSPFDNMELKTINDMEVLASILTTNNLEQSIHNINNNNNIVIDKEIGKNCLVLNTKNTEWGFAPLNGYHNIGYSNSDYDNHHTVAPPHQKDFNQYGFYPVREHIQISNFGLNDFSNQFGAAVSLERATTFVNRQEPRELDGERSFLIATFMNQPSPRPSNRWKRSRGSRGDGPSASFGGKPFCNKRKRCFRSDEIVNLFPEKSKPCEVKEQQAQDDSSKSVPNIMLELEKELQESREREEELERRNKLAYLKQAAISSTYKDKMQLPESSRKIDGGKALSKLPDPTSSLSPSSQKLVRYISEMGFPMPRVARACEMFNGNDKKIVEFLVQVQSLEEKNYPGDLVEKALIINKFKLNESLRYLEAMVVLLDLGFDEERAEEALIAADSDRDRALDLLIS